MNLAILALALQIVGATPSSYDATAIHKWTTASQSIAGPIVLSCSVCTALTINAASGQDAIKFAVDGARFNLSAADASAYFYRSAANTIRTPGALAVGNDAYITGQMTLGGALSNSGASNGGSLAINDPVRWLSTTTGLLESSTTATGGVDIGWQLNTLNTLSAGDYLLKLTNNGTDVLTLTAAGAEAIGSTMQAAGFTTTGTSPIGTSGNSPLLLKGNQIDGATAVAVKTGTNNSMNTDGGLMHGFYKDNFTTLRASISNEGAFRPSIGASSVAAVPAAPYTCGGASPGLNHCGELIQVRDTDAGAGVWGFACFCQCDGQATPSGRWVKPDMSTACF